MNNFTIIIPFYNDYDRRLPIQLKYWNDYPDWCWDHIKIVLVDDCSPIPMKEYLINQDLPNADIRLYKIVEDIRWNLPGAYNVGIKEAETKWVWCMDSDHTVPKDSLIHMLNMQLDEKAFYQHMKTRIYKSSTDTHKGEASGAWFHTKEQWEAVGGLNEDFSKSGGYDAWNWEYTWRLKNKYKHHKIGRNFLKRGIPFTMICEHMPEVTGGSTPIDFKITNKQAEINRSMYNKIVANNIRIHKSPILQFNWRLDFEKQRRI